MTNDFVQYDVENADLGRGSAITYEALTLPPEITVEDLVKRLQLFPLKAVISFRSQECLESSSIIRVPVEVRPRRPIRA